MDYATLRAASYVLVHTPDMVEKNGSTQTTERIVNPESEYLAKIRGSLRSYEDVVNYAPNQTYIGNMHYSELKQIPQPWNEQPFTGERYSKLGEIMPQKEFYGIIQICDVFELVHLEDSYAKEVKAVLAKHPLFKEDIDKIQEGQSHKWINEQVADHHAEGLYDDYQLIGCIQQAHEIDPNLNAHVMLENLVVKAGGVMALRHLLAQEGIDPASVDYVIECSEEACGDINQRGGGNFAKSIAELADCVNATGSDVRGFCAAPTHALINAAALVRSETFKNVVIVAGGATAKLGMNGKSHIEKGLPILEDVLGGFAALISENDGKHPVLRSDLIGRHKVASGSSPQAVTTALVAAPLDLGGYTVNDIDAYSLEMQNPDITKPAGAGDVPVANLKMIGAIGVIRKELERSQLQAFVNEKALPGWAPTQGHIPSGVPYLGFAVSDLTSGDKNRAMIVGKGSLFLGRMTNLFDGMSIIIERNSGELNEATNTDLKVEVKQAVALALREFTANMAEE